MSQAICVVGLVSLVLAMSAGAGEYHVYTCRTPSGEAAPADGWSGTQGPTDDSYAKDTCAEGGALIAALGDQSIAPRECDEAQWSLSVPSAETMVGATLWRDGDADGGASEDTWYLYALSAPRSVRCVRRVCVYGGVRLGKGRPRRTVRRRQPCMVPSADLGSHVYLQASCVGLSEQVYCPAGKGDANGYAAVVYLYAADLVLEQNEGPIAKEASGPLASEPTVQGTSDLTFNATDPGAGVWEVTFAVDGRVVQSTVPDENRGHCRDVGQTTDGTAAFLVPAAVPAGGERGRGIQHDGGEQRRAPSAGHAVRPGGQLGDRARPRDRRAEPGGSHGARRAYGGEARADATPAGARHPARWPG